MAQENFLGLSRLRCSFTMPSVIIMLIILLWQHSSWASPAPDDSSFNSLDLFDPASESFSHASLDPNLSLDPLGSPQSESDMGLFGIFGQTNGLVASEDSGLVAGADDNCPLINGQSRKRNGETCTVPGLILPPGSEIVGGHDDEDLGLQGGVDLEGPNPMICSEIMFFFGRIFDVCCTGPYGPFAIDPDVRLIYSWINECRMGMFKSNIIALICF